ncbi:sensor histidine kinase [Hydrogenophaga sp. MI9]
MRNYRNSLRFQVVLLIGVLALASVAGFTLIVGHLTRSQIEQDAFTLQRHLATRMSTQMAHDMQSRGKEMQFLSRLERIRNPARSVQEKQAALLEMQHTYPVYAWVGLTDVHGTIIASTEPRLAGAQVPQRSWFVQGSQGLYFEGAHEATLLAKLLPPARWDELPMRLLDVSLPVLDKDGQFIGVLAAHLSLDWAYELRAQLLASVEDERLEMLLFDREGRVIVGSPGVPAMRTPFGALASLRESASGRMDTRLETWPDGGRYLTTAAPAGGSGLFPGLGWTVVIRAAEDVAFIGANRLALITVLCGMVVTMVFSLLMWHLVGRQMRPLERVSEAAQQLDAQGLMGPLPEPHGDGEVAVFTRSLTDLVNALRESRERFELLFEHAPVALAFIGPDGRVLNTNARFASLFGYGRHQIDHVDTWFRLAYPDPSQRAKAQAQWQRARQSMGQERVELPGGEYAVHRQGNEICIVETSAIAMKDGLLVSFHDLTERRQAEAGLHLWAEAFERSEVGLLVSDAVTNTVIAANPAFSRQRGYAPGDLTGAPVETLYPLRCHTDLQIVLSALDTQDHCIFESEHIARDGRIFPVLIDVTVLRDAEGHAVKRVSHVLDLTERKRAEQEVLRLNAELEQRVQERTAELSAANRDLDSFAYSVSHDLRAPLRSVNGFAQILESGYTERLDDEGRSYLQRIRQGTQKMAELIEGLLALSRYAKAPLHRERVDLSAMATRRLQELAATDPARNVWFEVQPGLVADGDASLTEALLVNLLDNAWKYTGKTAAPRIRVYEGELSGQWGFCVSDNGAGFDMIKAHRLFEPFQRLHQQSEFQGTGVGLATVRRIVERHGGRILVNAAPGQGATFCFTLSPDAGFTAANGAIHG